MVSTHGTRIGRPPKLDRHGVPTRERLLKAAVDACVERGYDGATLAEIARAAGVSTPAVYSHFASKAELMVEASRRELARLGPNAAQDSGNIRALVARWMEPDLLTSRRLVLELHLASTRSPDVAELLDAWTAENAQRLGSGGGLSAPQVKMLYLLLLGVAHHERIDLDVTGPQLDRQLDAVVDAWLAPTQ